MLSSTSLNPRKGLAIWFGGLGSLWFRERLKEIKALAGARLNLGIGEASYAQATTMAIGLFVVLGFVVIVNGGYGGKTDFLAFLLYSGFMMGSGGPHLVVRSGVSRIHAGCAGALTMLCVARRKEGRRLTTGHCRLAASMPARPSGLRSTLSLSPAIESR